MIGEALMGLGFSPNPAVARLLAPDNEDTNSTQPGVGDSYPPLTPGSDFFFSGALETPRYFHNAPSPLPSPFAPTVSEPLPAPHSNNDLPETFPPAPLTPYSDLPTPGRWPCSPTPPKLTPGMFLQTPESLKRKQGASYDGASQPPKQVQEPKAIVQEAFPPRRSPLNAFDTSQDEEEKVCIYRGKTRPKTRREDGRRPSQTMEDSDTDNQNDVQVCRRLFDQGDEDWQWNPVPTYNTVKQYEHPDTANIRPQDGGSGTTGMKSRLAPPPPITVPGPSNTTPGGIYPLSKNPIRKEMTATETHVVPKICLPALNSEQQSEPIRNGKDAQQQQKKIIIPDVVDGQQRKKKKKSRAKPHIEEKRPMSERASLVLAEMRRQMSQAQAGGDAGASSGAVAVGTDATNFLPYSSAVQAPLNTAKETERPQCNCKASQCIKRYCPCFATSNFCGKGCGCRNCENTSEYSSVVGRARRVLLERDPNAFVPRIRNTQRSSGRGRQTIRGCNCRKGCQKNYCICKENGLICGVRCTCSGPNGCQNYDESKLEEVPQVLENAPPSSSAAASFLEPKKSTTAVIEDIQPNMKHAEPGKSVKPESINRNQLCDANKKKIPDIHVGPGLGPFEFLPTPTTPSIPYNPFSAGDPSRKRTITFGNPLDSFKKIKVGDHNGTALPELKQSSPRYSDFHYKTPPPKPVAPPGRGVGTPLTTRLLSGDTPTANDRDKQQRRETNDANMNPLRNGNVASIPSEDKRLTHIPRIFRYKFGSGKRATSFAFKR